MTTPEHSQRTLQSDLDDLRQSIDVWILSIRDDIACREKVYVALLAAAKEMLSAIATRDIGSFTWESRASKSLQAAISKAEEPAT